MQTLTKEQFEKLYGTTTVNKFKSLKPSGELEQSGYSLDETMQDIKGRNFCKDTGC
jgi:hypothetical protein